MRLAILGSRGIPARYGGFETFAEQIAVRLAAAGVEVTVFCPSESAKPDTTYRGVQLRYVTRIKLNQVSELAWDIRCLWAARRGFDVVYMLGVGAGPAIWIPRISGSAVWVNSDGLEWKRSKWGALHRLYLSLAELSSFLFASRTIADANAIADYLRMRYPIRRPISTIPYGAQLQTKSSNTSHTDRFGVRPREYYLVVCRLEPENHVREIIEGFVQSKSEFPLLVVGNVSKPNSYVRALLRHTGDRVRFLGTIFDQEKLGELRSNAKAYLHGHSVGGTNPSLLEAMACANLVIAHNNPFNREVLEDSGLFFSNRGEICETVNAIEEGRVDVGSRRDRAFAIVQQRYQWEQIAQKYLELLDMERHRSAIASAASSERNSIDPVGR